MKKLFEYFEMSQKEQRGLLFLLSLMFLLILAHFILPWTIPSKTIQYHIFQEKRIEKPIFPNSAWNKNLLKHPKEQKQVTYFDFDPNTLSMQGWILLGLTEKQAQVLLNYVSKGGVFRKKEDLAKIYSLSEEDVIRLTPYVKIKSHQQKVAEQSFQSNFKQKLLPKQTVILDVNVADTVLWMELKGIGSILSKRIVKFREALGGFHHIDQLKEVYGLSSELVDQLKPQLLLGQEAVQKLPINSIDLETLGKHPYVRYKVARLIINYRNQHGDFKEIGDLKQILTLNEDFIRKIEPYLDFRSK